MNRVTIVITQDSSNTYFLGIDLETGRKAFEDEVYTYEDGYDEGKHIADLCQRHNALLASIIYW